MSDRSQSDTVGVVLLTLIMTVTVTGTGVVALDTFQEDIGDEPLADIETTLTVDELTLEHLSGSDLAAEDVTVQIANGGETYSLTEFDGIDGEFTAGMRVSLDEIDTRSGGVTVRIIHEPSQKVLEDELHDLGFPFLIGGETGSIFLVPATPTPYTAPDTATVSPDDGTVISVDESAENVTGLMTGATTVTANGYSDIKTIDVQVIERDQLNVTTHNLTVTDAETLVVHGELTELGALDQADLYVRYRKQQPVTFNGTPNKNDDDVISHGEYYTDPDGYAHDGGWVHDNTLLVPGTNRTYEYRTDEEIYSILGTLRDEPETEDTADADDFAIDEIGGSFSWDFLRRNNNVPTDETFEIRVEYAADGESVRVYVEGELERTWDRSDGVDNYHELYFSTREGGAPSDDEDGLRQLSSPTLGPPQLELIEPGVEAPRSYRGVVSGVSPGSVYVAEAYAEREISNAVINDSGRLLGNRTEGLVATRNATTVTASNATLQGELINSLGDTDISFVVVRDADSVVVAEPSVETGVSTAQQFNTTISGLQQDTNYTYYARAEDTDSTGSTAIDTGRNVSFRTDEPVVETLDTTATGGDTINATGELVDIAGLAETDLYFRYRKQQPVVFNGTPNKNDDDVISHGDYYTGPDGYAHKDGWVHDNTPLVPGTNRTYKYRTSADIFSIIGTLRAEPETEETENADEFAIDEVGGSFPWNFIRRNNNVPTNEPFEVRVEYAADGESIRVYLNGNREVTWDSSDGVDNYHELYFSSGEGDGGAWSDPANGLLQLSSPTLGASQSQLIDPGVETPTEYSGDLTDLDPDSVYFVTAYSEAVVDGEPITASGTTLAVKTDGIVDTDAPTDITAESVQLNGELTASLGDTDLSFVVVRDSDNVVVAEESVESGVSASQQFNTTVTRLQQDTNYTYYARAEDTDSEGMPVTDTGENVSFTTDSLAITTLSTESTGLRTANVTGNLTDIGGLDETDLYVRYRKQQPVVFNGTPNKNDDDVISHGGYYPSPNGYAHDGGWVHDNTPLVPGTVRSYEYRTDEEIYSILGTLRDEPETEKTADADDFAIDEVRGSFPWSFLRRNNNVPTDETFEIRVEYAADGESIRVYVEGNLEQTWRNGIDSYHELYFSTREAGGPSDDEDGLRQLSSPTLGPQQSTLIESGVTGSTTYTGELGGLDPSTVYFTRAHTNVTVNGQLLNATGKSLAVETDSP